MALRGERVIAVISPRSSDGRETVGARTSDGPTRTGRVKSLPSQARFVTQVLAAEGFEILNFHAIAISFAGTPEDFERVFGVRPIRRIFPGGRGYQVDGFDIKPEDAHRLQTLPAIFQGFAGDLAIARPPRLIDDAGMSLRDVVANDCAVWSLPDEIAMATWADGAHAPVVTGQHVVVAQIGTGHFRHRFFSDRDYRVLPTLLGPGQQHPQRDDHGQSTGEAACLFSAAPDLKLRPIKGLLDPVGDLLIAIDSTPNPNLLINSWGYDAHQDGGNDLRHTDPNLYRYLKILDNVIAYAVARGVIVSALAPKAWKSFPACHPDVVAITPTSRGRPTRPVMGGPGVNGLYPEKQAPDLSWDAAKSVRGGLDLIGCTHPVQPGSVLAAPLSMELDGDQGFAWCDIDLAAAPLAAARLALLLEQHPGLSPQDIKDIVLETADALETRQADEPKPRIETPANDGNIRPKLARERSA